MTEWLPAVRLTASSRILRRARSIGAAARERWAARWLALSASSDRRWRALTPRERKQLALMAVVLAGAALWLVFTKPALDTLRRWDEEMPRLRAQSAVLGTVLAEAGAAPPQAGSPPPAARAAASLDRSGFTGAYRLSDRGTELLIAFERPVEAKPLLAWLLNAPPALGLPVRQAVLERPGDTPPGAQDGRIKATITLAAQPQPRRNGT
ncbi:type II secretion system protein GspM [Paludibacterium paludis]|uniref:Type II secretion system protein n=1 Tax=Paludibacterium paludis TaxID=1225769 RepID=A0A918NXQ0_9NEIS|nr:type II secretion system protein GspM [Paludibacterium paludis]GGY04292.1 type II secretion system protein [Paludibacterium paludis]